MNAKIFVIAVMLSVAATIAQANVGHPVKKVNARAQTVVDAYITAAMSNDAELLDQVLHSRATLKVNREDRLLEHKKKDLIQFLRKGGPISFNCKASQEILSECDCVMLVRVDFTFPDFIQQNYVQVEKDPDGVWMISQINRFNTQH